LDDYNKAIEIDSLNPIFYLNRAKCKFNLELYSSSLDDYNVCLSQSKAMDENDILSCYEGRALVRMTIGDEQGYEIDMAIVDSLSYKE